MRQSKIPGEAEAKAPKRPVQIFILELGVVVYCCNLCTQEVGAGESQGNFDRQVSSRPASAT